MKIAIFPNQTDAQAYSDKIHAYLLANRPGYKATSWATPQPSADGLTWFVKAPIEEEVQKWPTPINVTTELTKASGVTQPLPASGTITAGQYYTFKSDIVKCIQTHQRTEWEPKDTPALFSFFRDNSDQLQWISGEQVQVGWQRIFNLKRYVVMQAHQTQDAWNPELTAGTLWQLVVTTSAWVIGVAYKVNDLVTYNGNTYKCLQSHTSITSWNPVLTINVLWQRQ